MSAVISLVPDLPHARSAAHAPSCGAVAVDLQVTGLLGLDQVGVALGPPGSRTACRVHLGSPWAQSYGAVRH
eukprot:2349077-Pyramimonas_sp.AAC.1